MTALAARRVDPITVEVIGHALESIVEEMGETLVRALYSTNIKERRDSSTCLFDAQGRTLCQASHIPMHLGSLIGVIEEIGDLGVKQLQLQETTIRQNDFITALDMQIGNVEDVDMSSALSALTATQTSLEASYRMLTLMRDMTLVKYL